MDIAVGDVLVDRFFDSFALRKVLDFPVHLYVGTLQKVMHDAV